MAELAHRLSAELASPPPDDHVCRGTLLSRAQFLIEVGRWGYADARLVPRGTMTVQQVAAWTVAIGRD